MLYFLAEQTLIIYVQFIIGSREILRPFKKNRSRTILNISFQTAILNTQILTTHLQRLFESSE